MSRMLEISAEKRHLASVDVATTSTHCTLKEEETKKYTIGSVVFVFFLPLRCLVVKRAKIGKPLSYVTLLFIVPLPAKRTRI